MKNDSIVFDEARRDKIWSRVLGNTKNSDSGKMADILSLEHEQLGIIKSAGIVSGIYRQLLSSYLAAKKSRIGRLEARYYILTGEKYVCDNVFSAFDIRSVYENSAALSAMYTSSAISAKPDIAVMYRENANFETNFCGKLLYLIEQSLGKSH